MSNETTEEREMAQTEPQPEADAVEAADAGVDVEVQTPAEVAAQDAAEAAVPEDAMSGAAEEVALLRESLQKLEHELSQAQQERESWREKYLRARADLDNYRRRSSQEVSRAKEAGLDSAMLPVLRVYDDLARALEAAKQDPSSIVPGVEAVRDGLKRNLESLGIKEVGAQGDTFDPDFHEALSSMATEDAARSGTIARVFEPGFVKGDRLVRPARVAVYQN